MYKCAKVPNSWHLCCDLSKLSLPMIVITNSMLRYRSLLQRKKQWGTSINGSAMFMEMLQSMGALLVAWAKTIRGGKVGEAQLLGVPCSSWPVTAVKLAVLQHADAVVHEDQHIATLELAFLLSINKGSIKAIICELKYSMVCAKSVSRRSHTSAKNWENSHFLQVVRAFRGWGG